MAAVGLGLAAWWWRDKLRLFSEALSGIKWLAERGFGFDSINAMTVQVTEQAAEDLRGSQTGLLNWNVLAIVISLVLVITLLALGA